MGTLGGDRIDARLHGNDDWRNVAHWVRWVATGWMPPPSVIPAKAGIHLHMARRVSGLPTDGWMPGWIPVCTGMTERGMWRIGCPGGDRMDARSFCHARESGNLSSHGKAGVWPTNRRMDARMDSRLHGNDGKRDVACWVRWVATGGMPAPSVIPAKAGIYLHMARRVSGLQTDGWMPG